MDRKGFAHTLIVLIIVAILAIGISVWYISRKSSIPSTFANNFQYGEIVTSTMGSAGGILENSNKSIIVTIPPAALTQTTTLTLSFKRSDYAVAAGIGSPITFTIDPDVNFNSAISVKIKYDPSYQLPVPYLIDDQNKLHAVDLGNLDKQNYSFTMGTFHGGDYSWIYAN